MGKYALNNEEFEMVLIALRSHGHDDMYLLSDRLEADELGRVCPKDHHGEHDMVKPEDTECMQWGDYGICQNCYSIRRME